MSKHKSQHFVPRCYLRNFTNDVCSKKISLFNIIKDISVEGAPIKSQCAKPYFYGHDEFELVLGEIESKYDEYVTRGFLKDFNNIIDGFDDFIKFFLLIQFGRTEAQALKMKSFYALAAELANLPKDYPDRLGLLGVEGHQIARDGIYFALKMQDSVNDLNISYLINNSDTKIITSDDPVVLTNRLYLQKLKFGNFGVGSAGAIFYMPISPKFAVIMYDSDVYYLGNKNKKKYTFINDRDVLSLNALTIVNARMNLYSGSLDDFNKFHIEIARACRIDKYHAGEIAELIEEVEGRKIFKVVADRPEQGGYLMHIAQDHPAPPYWPKFLKFRSKPTAFSNGSGAGLVRRATIPPASQGFVKISV